MRRRELVPLGDAALSRQDQAEARQKRRLDTAWAWVVGPALVGHTRLLRVHRGVLVMGCWHNELIPNLRLAAETVWPQIQERLKHALGLQVLRIEVEPCDPPEPTVLPTAQDPLQAVLDRLRQNRHWTLGQR